MSAEGDRMGACPLVCLAYSVSITVDYHALSHEMVAVIVRQRITAFIIIK